MRVSKIFIFLSLFFMFGNSTLHAQNPTVTEKTSPRDRLIITYSIDHWLQTPEGITQPLFSPGFKVYYMFDSPFGSSPLSAAFGLGISADNVRINGDFIYEPKPNKGEYARLTPFPDSYHYSKNKIGITYAEIPVELRFVTNGTTPFRIHAGLRFGYLLQSKRKVIDNQGKQKYFGYENMDKFRIGLGGRIGIGKFAISGFYSLTPVFDQKDGTPIVPYSIGLSLVLF